MGGQGAAAATATIRVSSHIRRAPGQHLHAIRLAIEIHALSHRTADGTGQRQRIGRVIDRRDTDVVRGRSDRDAIPVTVEFALERP